MDDPLPSPRFSLARRAVTAIALCWLSLLFWMAATTGNPVVLSRVQILKSDCVLTAEVSSGKVARIINVWNADRPDQPVALPEGQRLQNGEYIVPLSQAGGQFVVTPLPLLNDGKEVRVIYPLTEQTRTQLESLVGDPEGHDGG